MREEQIIAMKSEIGRRDRIIEDLHKTIVNSNEKMEALSARLDDMLKRYADCQRKKAQSKQEKKITSGVQVGIKSPKLTYRPADFKSIFASEPFPEFFTLSFDSETDKRSTCPFVVEEEIVKILDSRPMSVTTHSERGLLIRVQNKSQTYNVLQGY